MREFLILLLILSISLSLALCTGNQKVESREAKVIKLMDSKSPIDSIQKLGNDRFLLQSTNVSINRTLMKQSSNETALRLAVRFCEGKLEVVKLDRTKLSVEREWNKTLKWRVFSRSCITDLNGDGRKDILVAIEDDPNHYKNATEVVAFVSKNKGYEERKVVAIDDFFVWNIYLLRLDGKENIVLTGWCPKERQGKVIVVEGNSVRGYRLGNETREVFPADVDGDGRTELVVFWTTLQKGVPPIHSASAFVSVLEYPFKEVERIKLPIKIFPFQAAYGDGKFFVIGRYGLYVLDLQNEETKEIYRTSSVYDAVLKVEVRNGNPTILTCNLSDKYYPERVLRFEKDAIGYHVVSEVKLKIIPVLSIDFDNLLIGSSKGLYLVEV